MTVENGALHQVYVTNRHVVSHGDQGETHVIRAAGWKDRGYIYQRLPGGKTTIHDSTEGQDHFDLPQKVETIHLERTTPFGPLVVTETSSGYKVSGNGSSLK